MSFFKGVCFLTKSFKVFKTCQICQNLSNLSKPAKFVNVILVIDCGFCSLPLSVFQFLPFKDSISTLLRSSVVYCYKCLSCNAQYYGKTSFNLAIRCREHIGATKTGYKINNISSVIYNHSSSTEHSVSPEDLSIISSARNSIDLLIHESLLILRDRPTLNSQTSSIQLTLFYLNGTS